MQDGGTYNHKGGVGGRPHPILMDTWLMGKATSGSSDLTKKNTIYLSEAICIMCIT